MDCPFCAEEINDKAKKCKHCGEFLTGGALSHTTAIQTTQSTSKKLKGQLILAVLVLIIGMFIMFSPLTDSSVNDPKMSPLGILITFVSFVWISIIKFRIWWNHK